MSLVAISTTTHQSSLVALATAVHEQCGWVVNSLQVAALLESMGINDVTAQQQYGYSDVFVLAEKIMAHLPRTVTPAEAHPPTPLLPPETWRDWVKNYGRGPLALLPMLLISLLMRLFQGYGQWQNQQVVLIGVAMLASLFVTNGFVQAVSRRASIFLSQGYVLAAQRAMKIILGAGMGVVLVTAVGGAAVASSFGWLTLPEATLLAVAYVILSAIWFMVAVLYLLESLLWFAIGLGLSTGFMAAVLALIETTGQMGSAWLLLAALTGLGLFAAVFIYATRQTLAELLSQSKVNQKQVVFPPWPQMAYSLWPYFMYGTLYIFLIIVGHVLGWLGYVADGSRSAAIFSIELSLTFALGGFILVSGAAENTIHRFWRRVQIDQLRTPRHDPTRFRHILQRFAHTEQRHFMLALLICSLAVLGLVYLVQTWLGWLPWTAEAKFLFVVGLLSYDLLAWGLFHAMFLITLSQPRMAISALLWGLVVTVLVGGGFSFFVAYYYVAIGIFMGAAVFLLATQWYTRRLWQHADYYYYASF